MKSRINTLPEAIEAAKEVTEYLTRLSQSLGLSQPGSVPQQKPTNGTTPKGTTACVVEILTGAVQPMMPKDIVNRYEELGYPELPGGRTKLYEAVSGSVSYLLNRKRILMKTPTGYQMKK